jgi:hypothetical protein
MVNDIHLDSLVERSLIKCLISERRGKYIYSQAILVRTLTIYWYYQIGKYQERIRVGLGGYSHDGPALRD